MSDDSDDSTLPEYCAVAAETTSPPWNRHKCIARNTLADIHLARANNRHMETGKNTSVTSSKFPWLHIQTRGRGFLCDDALITTNETVYSMSVHIPSNYRMQLGNIIAIPFEVE